MGCSVFEGVLTIETLTSVPPNVSNILKTTNISDVRGILNGSRRIIAGEKVTESRPYMVYLKLPRSNHKYKDYRQWLCGGVIVHEEYVLTSAACIEDAKHFYVVSGTHKYSPEDDHYNNLCIKNGAKKAVWKCIPRNYVFDGHENDNIRWMNNDIAIVKVEDEFDFTRRIRGCDFCPQPVRYNNVSKELERPDSEATIVGWGSTLKYNDMTHRGQSYSQDLLQSNVIIISKSNCKRRWGPRYHNIIDNYMICSKDNIAELSEICQEKYVDCTDIMYSAESGEGRQRRVLQPKDLQLHSAHHNATRKRMDSGGFCENDHGGPLLHGNGVNSIVIGIISACLVKEGSNICYGPFLYTSVYKNRNLINCAIYKDVGTDCNKLFRSSETHDETHISWVDHPDGPAKSEVNQTRRDEAKLNKPETIKISDKVIQHEGVVLRSFDNVTQKTGNNMSPT